MVSYNKQPTRQLQLAAIPIIEITKHGSAEHNMDTPKRSPSPLDRFMHMINGTKPKQNASISSSRWTISNHIYDKECDPHSTEHLMVEDCKRCKSSLSLNNTNTSPVKKSNSKLSLKKYLPPKLSIKIKKKKTKKKVSAESDSSIERESISTESEPPKKWYKRFQSKKSAKSKDVAMNA